MVFDHEVKHYKETSIVLLTEGVQFLFFVAKERQKQASQVTMCNDSM